MGYVLLVLPWYDQYGGNGWEKLIFLSCKKWCRLHKRCWERLSLSINHITIILSPWYQNAATSGRHAEDHSCHYHPNAKILLSKWWPIIQVIAAEGEHKASRSLRLAAEVIADSPAALQVGTLWGRWGWLMWNGALNNWQSNTILDCQATAVESSILGNLLCFVFHVDAFKTQFNQYLYQCLSFKATNRMVMLKLMVMVEPLNGPGGSSPPLLLWPGLPSVYLQLRPCCRLARAQFETQFAYLTASQPALPAIAFQDIHNAEEKTTEKKLVQSVNFFCHEQMSVINLPTPSFATSRV